MRFAQVALASGRVALERVAETQSVVSEGELTFGESSELITA